MKLTAKEFLEKTKPDHLIDYFVRPRAYCADGYSISIQANSYAYCTPRRPDADEYSDVELGFPLKEDDLIIEWAEDENEPTKTIYPFTPMHIVEKLIEKHGGIVGYVDTDKSVPVMF